MAENKKVIRFRTIDPHGNPWDAMIGHCNRMEYDYKKAENITDIYLREKNYGDYGVDYIVAVYPSSEQVFIAKNLEYYELATPPN